MDPKAGDNQLLDELLGIDPRAFDDEERTLVISRSDPPPPGPAQASDPGDETPDDERQTSIPPEAVPSRTRSDAPPSLEAPPEAALPASHLSNEPRAVVAAPLHSEQAVEASQEALAPVDLPRFESGDSDPAASPPVSSPVASPPPLTPQTPDVAREPSNPPPPSVAVVSSPGEMLLKGGPDDTFIGELVDGRYRVLRLLGVGGIGLVYLCRHELLEKPVALKVLRAEYVLHEDLNARFLNEARAASAIKSPRIVDTLDVGTLPNGAPYFVMEYVEGETLAALLDREGSMSLPRALDVVHQLAEGLEAAHAAGVVHRDLKPENVFLAQQADGLFAKIFDFGIAKVARARKRLTYAGAVFGTPHYMSPEQARGDEVDARSDLYALGVMLFEMVTGRVPFDGEDPLAVMSQHVDRVPPLMGSMTHRSIPADLEAIVARCLAKDPRDRYATAGELLRDIDALPAADLAAPDSARKVPESATIAAARLPSLSSRPETLHAHVVPAAAKPRGLNRLLAVAALLAIAAAAVVVVVRRSQSSDSSAVADAARTPAARPLPSVAGASDRIGTQEPATREVHFVLSPIDSHVFRGDDDLGPMPVSVQVVEGTPQTLTVRRKGYTTRRVVVDGSETRVVVGLMRAEPQVNLSKVPPVIRRKF